MTPAGRVPARAVLARHFLGALLLFGASASCGGGAGADAADGGGRDAAGDAVGGDRRADLAGDGEDAASDGDARPAGEGPRFLYDPASTRTVPLPSDLFRDPASGQVRLPDAPSGDPGADVQFLLDAVAGTRGAGLVPAVGFPHEGKLDAARLDATATGLDGPVGLARLEADGSLVAVPVTVTLRPGRLVLAPVRGTALREDADHVAWVRDGVADAEGRAASADPRFEALRDAASEKELAEPLDRRQHALLAPLFAALEQAGVERSSVVAATRFRTQPIGDVMARAVEVIEQGPVPTYTVDEVRASEAALDDLLGVPAAHLPGTDNAGVGMANGLAHDAILAVVRGRFDAYDFVSDDGQRAAGFRYAEDGTPELRATRPVPFLLVLPREPAGGSFATTPVVVWHHGLNNSRASVFGVADALAHAGLAVLAYDAVFHGARGAGAVDEQHNLTGAPGPDGLADLNPTGGLTAIFGLGGDPPFDPVLIRDSFRQLALDVHQAARALALADPAPLRKALAAASPALAELAFAGPIGYIGESLGGITGALAASTSPSPQRIGAFVLSVPGGAIVSELVFQSAAFSGLARTLAAPALGLDPDVLDPDAFPPGTEPTLALVQQVLDDGDPLAHAASRDRAALPHVLLFQAEHDELIAHPATQALAGVLGLEQLVPAAAPPPLRFVPLGTTPAPAAGNLDPGGPAERTGVLVALTPATHGVTINQRGEQRFEPGGPPFMELPAPVVIDNPIVELQAVAAQFLLDHALGATPRVLDPASAPTPFLP